METKYCTNCGKPIVPGEFRGANGYCIDCTAKTTNTVNTTIPARSGQYSDKDWLVTLLFSIFLGWLGIHRFYVGKIGTGILWLLTGGCLGIGALVDIIMIATENFTDENNRLIVQDSRKNPQYAYANATAQPTRSTRDDALDQLSKLAALRDSGAITQEEYEQKKAALLAKI